MTTLQPTLRLSFPGRLAVVLALSYVSSVAWADIVGERNGAQKIYKKGDVEIVDIVSPNSRGLSHNKYYKYSVDKAGAVLNNSLKSGSSVLAGELNANANFKGATAKVILNEVIRHNPSLLLGKQEVFGMVADYVLANPSGITCQGCGFINVPRASLVVGKPIVENDDLSGYEITSDKKLALEGELNDARVLDLLAPAVDINGEVSAQDEVNIVMGRNQVSRDASGNVVANKLKKHQHRRVLDGHLLGSIQSGRIRIHSTDSRATVVGEGLALRAGQVQLTAGNADLRGKIDTVQNKTAKVDKLGDGVFLRTDTFDKKQAYRASELVADNAQLNVENKLNINGAKIKVRELDIAAGNANFDAQVTKDESTSSARRYKGLWFHTDAQKQHQETVHGTQIESDIVRVAAASDLTGKALTIQAQGVELKAGRKLSLSGTTQETLAEKSKKFRNEIDRTATTTRDRIKNGDALDRAMNQAHVASTLSADKLVIDTGGDMSLSGVTIQADSLVAKSGGKVNITADETQQETIKTDMLKYWAGFGGSNSAGDTLRQKLKVGSDINTRQLLVLEAQRGVAISGSRVKSDKGAYVYTKQGDLTIDSVVSQSDQRQYKRIGAIFDITKDKIVTDRQDKENKGSVLASDSSLVLLSERDIDIVGSQVKANGFLDIKSAGKVNVAGAKDTKRVSVANTGISAEAKIDKLSLKDKEIKGHLALIIKNNKVINESGTHQAAQLSGKQGVQIAGDHIAVAGSRIESSQGNVGLQGSSITTTAQHDTESTRKTDTGATLTLSGGVNEKGVSIGLALDVKHKDDTATDSTVKGTQIAAGKDVSLKGHEIAHQGTHISGVTINESADHISHQAAAGGRTGSAVDASVHAGVDVNLGFDKGLAVGVGISGQGGRRDSKDTVVQGTKLDATVVNVDAKNKLHDEGTIYNGKDEVNLSGGNLELGSAYNEQGFVDNHGGGSVGINASTNDYNSVNLSLDVAANFQHEKENSAKAVKTEINSASVNVHAQDDLHSQADINSSGTVNMTAGKNLVLSQADNTDTKRGGGFDAKVGIGGLVIPAAGAAVPSINVAVSANGHNSSQKTGIAPAIHAKELNLGSQGDLHIQGIEINVGSLNAKGDKIVLTGVQEQGKHVSVDVGANVGIGANVSSLNLGGHLNVAHGKKLAHKVSAVNADTIRLDGKNGVDIVATKVNGQDVAIRTDGNVSVSAGANVDHHTNTGFALNLSGVVKDQVWTPAAGSASLNIDVARNESNTAGHSSAGHLDIQAGKDLTFKGDSLTANQVTGHVAGNVTTQGTQSVTHEGTLNLAASGAGSFTPYEPGKVLEGLKKDWENGTIAGISAQAKGDGHYVHKIENDQGPVGLTANHSALKMDGKQIVAPDAPEKHIQAGFEFDVGTNIKERLEKGQPLAYGDVYVGRDTK